LAVGVDDVFEELWRICEWCGQYETIGCSKNCLVDVLMDIVSCIKDHLIESSDYVLLKRDELDTLLIGVRKILSLTGRG